MPTTTPPTTLPSTLPSTLSDLIRLACNDLESTMKNPGYIYDPWAWHHPGNSGRCHVCLAGAVIAGSLGADAHKFIVPGDFAESGKLYALDWCRKGLFSLAMRSIGLPGTIAFNRQMPEDPTELIAALRVAADDLQAGGY